MRAAGPARLGERRGDPVDLTECPLSPHVSWRTITLLINELHRMPGGAAHRRHFASSFSWRNPPLSPNVRFASYLGVVETKGKPPDWFSARLTDTGRSVALLSLKDSTEGQARLLTLLIERAPSVGRLLGRLEQVSDQDREEAAIILGCDLPTARKALRLLSEPVGMPLLVAYGAPERHALIHLDLLQSTWRNLVHRLVDVIAREQEFSPGIARTHDVAEAFRRRFGVSESTVCLHLRELAYGRAGQYLFSARPGEGPDYYFHVIANSRK